jgi:pimeloyl-ACP methyl ester carboxylesterase
MRFQKLRKVGFWFDGLLFSRSAMSSDSSLKFDYLDTELGRIRIFDSLDLSKPPLVMVPDGPCFIEHFENLISLATENYRVLVFDLPGFGGSYPGQRYDHSFLHGAQVIRAILEKKDLKDVSLAFSCVNGFYALKSMEHVSNRLRQVVLMQTPHFEAMKPWADRAIPWPLRIPLLGQCFSLWQKFAIPKVWFRISLPKKSPHAESYTRTSLKTLAAGGCNCLASVVQGMALEKTEHLKSSAAISSVKIKAIWGTLDHSHKNTDPKSLLRLIPEADLKIWDDCGHFPNLEYPERFLAVLAE